MKGRDVHAIADRPRGGVGRAELHGRTRAELVDAVGDHLLAGGEPARDRGVATRRRTEHDRPHLDGLVWLHDVDEGAVLAALDGRGGRDHRVLFRIEEEPHVHELVREEHQVGVVEDRLQLGRAGRRVDLVVRGLQRAGRELGLPRAVVGFGGQAGGIAALADHGAQIVLRHGEEHGDRLHLRDHESPVASFACTTFPTSTRRRPMRPLIGAVTRL
jgi:hypothetical protein